MASELGRRIASEMATLTFEKVSEIGFDNACLNDGFIENGRSIEELSDTPLADSSDALIIAAGPSLHRSGTAELIRKSGFDGVIVATDSSMSWCLRHDIVPHLVVTLDPHAGRIVRWFGDPNLDEHALACDDYFSRQDMDPKFRTDQLEYNRELVDLIDRHGPDIRIAISSSSSAPVVERVVQAGMEAYWWNPMYDDYEAESSLTRRIHEMNGLPCVNSGGNVGSACWVFAHAVLGKSRVGLIGMDFGYYDNTPYSQTQYYKEIVDLVGESALDEVFVQIRNPHLDRMFYTDPAYLWYRDSFLEMAVEADCVTHNCTDGGILFGPGVEWTSLPKFLGLGEADDNG